MEEEISLSEIFAILKQQIFLIIFLAILGVSISAVYTFSAVTPTYNATTQMLVNHKADILREIRLEDINTNVQMINTYKDIIKGPVILEQVQERLERSYSVGQLADMISISSNAESQVFSLTVTTASPTEAATIANEIASTFQTSIGKIMNVENVTIISVATINAIPVSPNVPMNLVLGLLVGGMVGVGIAFLRAFMDTTLKDSQFIAQEIGWSDLGAISVIKNEEFNAISEFYELENSTDGMRGKVMFRKNNQTSPQSAAITMAMPSAAISEQFRVLRTNIHFSMVDKQLNSLAITSASNNVGKSTVAINLAITIAQQGTRVLLVDCDFRRPTVHKHFKLANAHGLTDLLKDPTGVVQDYVQTTKLADLSVLTGGPTPPNPAELLSSKRMIHLERTFKDHFDFVIYDTPPLLGFADAQIVAGRADGTIFVVKHGVSTKMDSLKASEALKRVNAHVLGAVYNRVPVNSEDEIRYSYYQKDS